MELILINGCKSKKIEKTRHVKNNDKSKKYILGGERNADYHDRFLSKSRERLVVYK